MADEPAGAAGVPCSGTSLALAEPLAGSAPTTTGFLLLEHTGPWGADFLDDGTLPEGLGAWLRTRSAAAGLTPLLIRRTGPGTGTGTGPGPDTRTGTGATQPTVVVAVPDGAGSAVATRLTSTASVLDVDIAAVTDSARAGRVPSGWDPVPFLLAVCADARRDACCARLGGPLARRLTQLAPRPTWECTHVGGHRLAANVLALPSGVLYGRVPAEWAEHLLSAVAAGRVLVPLVRGRSSLPAPLQVAELALREHLDEDGEAAVRVLEHSTVDLSPATLRTTSSWAAQGATWRVVVDTAPGAGPPRPASCAAPATAAPPRHTVVEVADVRAAGRGAAGWDAAHRNDIGQPHPLVVWEAEGLPPGTALDLACGTGRHALWLAERGWHVTAVDFSRNGLQVGASQARARGVVVDWQLADARLWTPPHDGYDLVLMTYVHLPAVLPRALRWLRPGGRVVIVGHALRNATDGVGGPSDPRLLHDVVALAARVTGARLRVLRATEVERRVDAGVQVDALVVATRLPAGGPPGG